MRQGRPYRMLADDSPIGKNAETLRQYRMRAEVSCYARETGADVFIWVNSVGTSRACRFTPDSRCIGCDGPAANGRQGNETGFCFCVLKGYFARLNTNSRVTPAGVRGFVNFNSSSVIDVTIRR